MNKEGIILEVYNSSYLKESLSFVPQDLRDDMKAHIIEILLNYEESKLLEAKKNGWLSNLVCKIFINQYYSKTSTFFQIYKKFSSSSEEYGEIKSDDSISDVYKLEKIDKYLEELDGHTLYKYHSTLFKMYYYEGYTLKQIEALTEIKFTSVNHSIKKTLKYLKKRFETDQSF